MKIPQYEKQVAIQTTPVSEGKVPEVNQSAYGIDEAQATEAVGKQIEGEAVKLYTHFDSLQKDN